MDVDVAEPSDLYSAGILLYECLAGRPPFAGQTVGKILFEHMTAPVPELSAHGCRGAACAGGSDSALAA